MISKLQNLQIALKEPEAALVKVGIGGQNQLQQKSESRCEYLCESLLKQVIQPCCEASSLRHVCAKSWTSGKCTFQTINILTTNEATLGSLCSDSYYHPTRLCKCVQASKQLHRKTFWQQFAIIPISFCYYLLPKGSCHLRFSGFCTLRGGDPPFC